MLRITWRELAWRIEDMPERVKDTPVALMSNDGTREYELYDIAPVDDAYPDNAMYIEEVI